MNALNIVKKKMLDDDCRVYVCNSVFGRPDECIKFDNYDAFIVWSRNEGWKDLGNTSFQPVCLKYMEKFDKAVLMVRNRKMSIPNVTHFA